jgi:hypothetical protein
MFRVSRADSGESRLINQEEDDRHRNARCPKIDPKKCQHRSEITSLQRSKNASVKGHCEWFGLWQGEREGDLPLALATNM